MKPYKLIDFIIGILLIIICTFSAFVLKEAYFFYGYFVVGGWQLLSMLIHMANNDKYIRSSNRKIYEKMILWILIIGVLSLLLTLLEMPILIFYLYAMLIFSPVLAIYYQVVCYIEYRLLIKRAFIHLKN